MGLTRNNVPNGFGGRLYGAAQGAFSRGFFSILNNAAMFGQITSVPQGMNGQNALRMTLKVGGNISARFRSESALTGSLSALGNMAATVLGEFDMIGNANVASNGYATFAAEADMIAAASGIGSMSANMDLLARPSANDIAQEVWNARSAAFTSPGTLGRKLTDAEAAAKLGAALSA
jgi:hypothetical protein